MGSYCLCFTLKRQLARKRYTRFSSSPLFVPRTCWFYCLLCVSVWQQMACALCGAKWSSARGNQPFVLYTHQGWPRNLSNRVSKQHYFRLPDNAIRILTLYLLQLHFTSNSARGTTRGTYTRKSAVQSITVFVGVLLPSLNVFTRGLGGWELMRKGDEVTCGKRGLEMGHLLQSPVN